FLSAGSYSVRPAACALPVSISSITVSALEEAGSVSITATCPLSRPAMTFLRSLAALTPLGAAEVSTEVTYRALGVDTSNTSTPPSVRSATYSMWPARSTSSAVTSAPLRPMAGIGIEASCTGVVSPSIGGNVVAETLGAAEAAAAGTSAAGCAPGGETAAPDEGAGGAGAAPQAPRSTEPAATMSARRHARKSALWLSRTRGSYLPQPARRPSSKLGRERRKDTSQARCLEAGPG